MFDLRKSSIRGAAGVLSLLLITMSSATLADGLGAGLTPIGAERAGNAAGTIPAWDGGLTEKPAGWQPGDPRSNPYASDEKLFTIDASNAANYADHLSPGQMALLTRYSGYTMDVYPTRRSCSFPDRIYEATSANVTAASLDENGGVVSGYGGVLFPVPETGWEAILNHRTAFHGVGSRNIITTAVTKSNGSHKIFRGEALGYNPMYDPAVASIAETGGFLGKFIYISKEPTISAGTAGLVHDFFNQTRRSWVYLPGLRRVKMAPTIAYDNPAAGQDGLRTFDQTGMFNGRGDRYDWSLQGKQELYIPYNAWDIRDQSLSVADIVGEKFLTRALARYELHRVWKVQATLTAGARNIFSRRDFYLDEDSWNIVQADLYDARGELWRVQESHLFVAAELPACVAAGEFYYDLLAQRYVADSLLIGSDAGDYTLGSEINGDHFTPAYLRRQGRR